MTLVKLRVVGFAFLSLSLGACTAKYQRDLGGDPERVLTRTFIADFDTAWQAVLDALKSYPHDITNRESGFIQTRWVENTNERNWVESYGPGSANLKAQFRYRISLAKTRVEERPAVRVAVQRFQLIQKDVLEGWKPKPSDEIEEKTLLYRIGHVIGLRQRLARIEAARTQKQVEQSELLKK